MQWHEIFMGSIYPTKVTEEKWQKIGNGFSSSTYVCACISFFLNQIRSKCKCLSNEKRKKKRNIVENGGPFGIGEFYCIVGFFLFRFSYNCCFFFLSLVVVNVLTEMLVSMLFEVFQYIHWNTRSIAATAKWGSDERL